MLLKYFYDKSLAHASYLVGCQRCGTALVVDPGRDIDQYLQAAEQEGLKLVAVAETHIHADYVSGARELAARVGAKLYVSDEGPAEWKYKYLDPYDHQLLKDGDEFPIGNLKFRVMHTPGHTPESISFLLTDEGGGASEPMGIFTGDFVFVGSIGRPDLLEEAAGLTGTAEPGARALFHSAERFKTLPDYLQVWPAHGAGSACGKGLGAIPSSTVGYEKRYNPALQFTDEDEFVTYILSEQPEAPKYFAVMKRVNKEGPLVLGPNHLPERKNVSELSAVVSDANVIDLAPARRFAEGHVPGTLNIPVHMLAGWAGWLVDYSKPTYLIAEPSQVAEATRVLLKIGVDNLAGVFDRDEVVAGGMLVQSFPRLTSQEAAAQANAGDLKILDVRSQLEWESGHVPAAEYQFLGKLSKNLGSLDHEQRYGLLCQAGGRSAIATSLLQAHGFDVVDIIGGYNAWTAAGLPVEITTIPESAPACSLTH
ncbi:MAG: MBL fold metallo-hydrolase [Planctomycetaceae bacterium]|nr:MBL fold metallo-hydrolase [Planctomycetaceae bacterium]